MSALTAAAYVGGLGLYLDDWFFIALMRDSPDQSVSGLYATLTAYPNLAVRPVQALLLGLVLLHGLLGVRAILLDFGLPVRWHRALFAGAVGLGAVIFAVVWGWRWY